MVRPELHARRRAPDAFSKPVRPHFDSVAWRRRMDARTDEAVAALRAVLDQLATGAEKADRPRSVA
jgi:hypothetical protein